MSQKKAKRVARAGRAAGVPGHPHRDQDIAFILENWPQIAAAAWAGWLAHGRGETIIDARQTYQVAGGLGHAIAYVPAELVKVPTDARMVAEYDPASEVVVCIIQANESEDTYRLAVPGLTPAEAYAKANEVTQ